MRVLQVNKHYHPHVGGIERVVRDIAEGFTDEHESRALVATNRGRGERTTLNGVEVNRVSSLGTALSVPLAPTFPVALTRVVRDVDVVHYHLPNPLGVASHHLARPDAPLVVTYHSDVVRQAKAMALYRPLLQRFLGRADRIVTTSPRLRDHSHELTPHHDRCEVVPLGIDVERERSAPASDRFETDAPLVLCVGRLNYYKGVEYLVDAIAEVDPTARLLVVGDGDQRDALERRARERGIADRTTFAGYVPDADLRGAYEAADVFVLPSVERSEAFGRVQLEAMAHGLPVVNTDLPTGVPWVSKDGETGLTVQPRDADALADAIDRLLADPDLRRTYGQNGLERVREQFTLDAMLESYRDIYASVIREE